MKPLLLSLALLLCITSSTSAQDFRRETRATFWYYESVPYNDYGYGYRPYFPMRRYQIYQPPQQFYPAYRGVIPGAVSNGYFIPDFYAW